MNQLDAPFIEISTTLFVECLGLRIDTEEVPIRGKVYSLDNEPRIDVVRWMPPCGGEIDFPKPILTSIEAQIEAALWKEASSDRNRSRLEEAFEEWVRDRNENGQERALKLRAVG